MADTTMTRRVALAGLSGAATMVFGRRARSEQLTRVTFLTDWFAEAEHGGFYQAKAAGLYDQAGLDVTISMGGPQVNCMQLLTAGFADMIIWSSPQFDRTLGATLRT